MLQQRTGAGVSGVSLISYHHKAMGVTTSSSNGLEGMSSLWGGKRLAEFRFSGVSLPKGDRVHCEILAESHICSPDMLITPHTFPLYAKLVGDLPFKRPLFCWLCGGS